MQSIVTPTDTSNVVIHTLESIEAAAIAVPPKDWRVTPGGTYVRDLVGGEVLCAWFHENRDGGVRPTHSLDVVTKIPPQVVERRMRRAWLRCRLRYPIVALKYKMKGNAGIMYYDVPTDEDAQRHWVRNTLLFLPEEDAGDQDSIVTSLDNHNTHPSDGHARCIIVARKSMRHTIVLNTSHAHFDIFSVAPVWQTLVDGLCFDDEAPIVFGSEVALLPRSLYSMMAEVFPQTYLSAGRNLLKALSILTTAKSESVRMPMRSSFRGFRNGTTVLDHTFSRETSDAFARMCKARKTTVTYAYIAILALALQELFGSTSPGGGAAQVLAMPYNGRRWLPDRTTSGPPYGPALGTTTAYLRIEHDSKRSPTTAEERVRRILSFAKKYQQAADAIVLAPSPASVLAAKMLAPRITQILSRDDVDNPKYNVFGVVSQGNLERLMPTRGGGGPGQDSVDVVRYNNGGRIVDSNPFLVIFSWAGQMHTRLQWSNKYYEKEIFRNLQTKMHEYLADFLAQSSSDKALAGNARL